MEIELANHFEDSKPNDNDRGSNIASSEKTDQNQNRLNLSSFIKKIPDLFYWAICTVVLAYFSNQMLKEYSRNLPVTVTTFVDPPEIPDPVRVKICNSVFLDPEKILHYDGADISSDQFNFLYQAAIKNYSFNDRLFVLNSEIRQQLLLSSRTLNKFKLDKEKFMLFCYSRYYFQGCFSNFTWHLETTGGCYQADLQLYAYGLYDLFSIRFYFDPELALERYTRGRIGAYVSITHPQDSVSSSDTFFLSPNDAVLVSAKTVHKVQIVSFQDSKCVHRYGLETFNFTGEPFQTLYNTDSCMELCHAETVFKFCRCASTTAWNITKSTCLEDPENVECILRLLRHNVHYMEQSARPCVSKCSSKCEEKKREVEMTKVQLNLVKQTIVSFLNGPSLSSVNPQLRDRLLTDLFTNANDTAKVDQISKNFAELKFHMKTGERVTKMETVPLMSFGTLISNLGGLVGMWLGLSVVACFEFVKKTCVLLFCD